MPATPPGRGARPGSGPSRKEDGGSSGEEHARPSSAAQLYAASQAQRAQARKAGAGDDERRRQAELFAASRARRARPPQDDAAPTPDAVRPAERAGTVWPRGAARPAPPPPAARPRRPAPPPRAAPAPPPSRPRPRPAQTPPDRPPAKRARPPAPPATPPPSSSAHPVERPGRPTATRPPAASRPPERAAPPAARPAAKAQRAQKSRRAGPRPDPDAAVSRRPRPAPSPADAGTDGGPPTVAAPVVTVPDEPVEERTAVLRPFDVEAEVDREEESRWEPRPAPPRRPREAADPTRKEPFFRRHFLPPSAFGVAVVAMAIAVLTGIGGAYVWANNDAGRLRLSPPTPPSTVRPAELAPPPAVEATTTTRPDLAPDALARALGPAVWTVNTLDSAGQPVTGSAFLVGSPGGQGLLVTSLAVVEASTGQPAPEIAVKGGGYDGKATLWTWDEGRDLALLTVGRSATAPEWASESTPVKAGDRIFAIGGGGKVAPGVVTGVTGNAVQHNAFVDDSLRGGPLVNAKGDVVAVSSAAFTGGGKATDTSFFGVPVRAVCGAVLRCGDAALPPTTVTTVRGRTTTTRPG